MKHTDGLFIFAVWEGGIICSAFFYRPLNHVKHQWHLQGDQGKGKKLGIVTSFRYMYLGAVMSHNGSKSFVFSMIVQASAAVTKRMAVWRDCNIFLRSKMKLMPSLVTSILYAWDLYSKVRTKEADL